MAPSISTLACEISTYCRDGTTYSTLACEISTYCRDGTTYSTVACEISTYCRDDTALEPSHTVSSGSSCFYIHHYLT